MDLLLLISYRFFRRHGYSASSSLELVKAERLAESRGWSVQWEQDEDPYREDGHDDWCSAARTAGRSRGAAPCSHRFEGAVLARTGALDYRFALWGVVVAGQNYRRAVAAELYLEAANQDQWELHEAKV